MTYEEIFPLRIGKKQNKAILFNNGRCLVVMSNPQEAKLVCDALNSTKLVCDILNNKNND